MVSTMIKYENAKQRRDEAELAFLEAFRAYLEDPELTSILETDAEKFHEILIEARDRNWLHYTRIAAVMELQDSSAVSRWFKTGGARKSPDKFRRLAAIAALARIVRNDIKRIKCGRKPIGGLSMSEFPDTEVTPVLRPDKEDDAA